MNELPPRGSPPQPRRPPAHKSVSLRHRPPGPHSKPPRHSPQYPTTGSHFGAASDQANPPSSVSPKIVAKQSSGESSDAGKWFESTNNTAAQRDESFVDNEPPFFLRNSSSSGTPPEQQHIQSGLRSHQRVAMPLRPSLNHFPSETSSVEDFRSVIDDLTVANKRLKQRLRKYEKLYDAPPLQDDKLFEVRFHGLPDHKKKELEETLRKFAADLDANPADSEDPPRTSFAPNLDRQGASSLISRFAESGYASNSISASGQLSSLATGGQDINARKSSKSAFDRQQQNVQSYLHDIPAGLLPKHSAPMTDKSKKKLVVRRLEQIFAGKQSVPGNHPHPMQQEEVAQLAAVADRQAREASGATRRKEGLREARIMQSGGAGVGDDSLQQSRPAELANDQSNSGSGSPDQRPTRPLDLDPFRAQVPAENMEYIRHLGFTPPDMATGESPEDGHGWIYLNLLINMAQLHTINVTPDFVQDAVKDYSSKLELSLDGRKIRWKGGHDVTRTSSDSSSEHLDGMSPGKSAKSPKKHLQTGNSDSTDSVTDPERQARRIARATRAADQSRFAYTPMFYHKEDSDDDDLNELVSSSNSPAQPPLPNDPSSGIGSSTMRSSSSRKRRDDGPMIFYRAKFCTDLSGDQGSAPAADHSPYHSLTTQPLGALPSELSDGSSSMLETKGPLKTRPMQLEEKDELEFSSEDKDSLGFSPEALRNDTSDESPETMEFEASGLGGVRPEDNFAIRVRREQVQRDGPKAATERLNHRSRHYSKHILDALQDGEGRLEDGSSSRPVISERILSASRKSLPNSELPPASFLPFDSTSSGDVDSDLESDVSSSPSISESIKDNPAAMLSLRNISPTDVAHQPPNNNVVGAGEEDDMSYLVDAPPSDELEYDPAYSDKLAAEIPAGSSAATAGGGSGFNSPNAMVKDGSSNSGGSVSKSPNLKRTRTSDNMSSIIPGKAPKLE